MQRQLFIVLAALALSVPAASATWFGAGSFEPDTAEDMVGDLMWSDPPEGDGQIYFNAYASEGALRPIMDPNHAADGGAGTGVNPNSGTLGTRIFTPGAQGWLAILGVWKDCNGDNTIGLAESAMMSYPSQVLLDTSVCPPSAASMHNNGAWVHEYIPIGHEHLAPEGDAKHPVQIDDPVARVWGDIGRPTDAVAQTCPITPLPHGTTSGTGHLLRYADCFVGKRVTQTINDNDQTGLLDFEDENNPQESTSLLNQHFPRSVFGNPETGEDGLLELDSHEDEDPDGSPNYALTVFDCESGAANPQFSVESLTTGSFADTINHTEMSLLGADCDRNNGPNTNGGSNFATAYNTVCCGSTGVDAPHQGSTQNPVKEQNDFYFAYFNGEDDPTGLNTPTGLGTVVGNANFEPSWQSFVVFVAAPQSINRNTLQASGAAYFTFYATVDTGLFGLGLSTPGGSGKYGSEACGNDFLGQVSQGSAGSPWQCWPALDTSPANDEKDGWCPACLPGWNTYQGVPGTTYYFKDTDCLDGDTSLGVRASLTDLAPADRPNFCGDTANP